MQNQNPKLSKPMPAEVLERSKTCAADTENYQICMTIIKERIYSVEDIINDRIPIPLLMLKMESIYIQIRLILEMFYLSSIAIQKRRLNETWPQVDSEYSPTAIRKHLKKANASLFPRPFEGSYTEHGAFEVKFIEPPMAEGDVYAFFNKCHQYVHEPNPYKKTWAKRESECEELIKSAANFLKSFWALMRVHWRDTELTNGDKIGLICFFGERDKPIETALVVGASESR